MCVHGSSFCMIYVLLNGNGHAAHNKKKMQKSSETMRPTQTLDKSVYRKINFLISQPKHMLWVLKRTVSMRRFF